MTMAGKIWVRAFVAAAAIAAVGGAHATPFQDATQAAASERRAQGRNLPAREIERRTTAAMRGAQYLGFVYDPETDVYTLKFLRNGSVIWVYVDGRTGNIVRQTGN
ncbi:MAG: hypothetical protein ACOY45_11870 [Pseudomonadota bacterium]